MNDNKFIETLPIVFGCLYIVIELLRPQSMYNFPSILKNIADFVILGWILSLLANSRFRIPHNNLFTLICLYLLLILISAVLGKDFTLSFPIIVDFSKLVLIFWLITSSITKPRHLYAFVITILFILLQTRPIRLEGMDRQRLSLRSEGDLHWSRIVE